MAEAARLLDQGNNLADAIWDIYKSNKCPTVSGLNFNAPSPYVVEAMKRLEVHIRVKILPSLVLVLTTLLTSSEK